MKAFDRELDHLEETIVYLALVFLGSTILIEFLRPMIGFFSIPIGLVGSLSFLAAIVAILLWVLRRLGSPLYARLRGPEENRLQGFLMDPGDSTNADQDR